jgi:hypothetical protein
MEAAEQALELRVWGAGVRILELEVGSSPVLEMEAVGGGI